MPKPSVGGIGGKIRNLGNEVPGFQTSFNVAEKGGGAIQPVSENFAVNPVNGTLSLTLPIKVSPTREGLGPDLHLAYSSGAGNGPFGFGWNILRSSISRKTSGGIPRYSDGEDDIVFSGADIVPWLSSDGLPVASTAKTSAGDFVVTKYRPRIDSRDTRIEKWSLQGNISEVYSRTISGDNVTSIYGENDSCRIVDNADGRKRIFC